MCTSSKQSAFKRVLTALRNRQNIIFQWLEAHTISTLRRDTISLHILSRRMELTIELIFLQDR